MNEKIYIIPETARNLKLSVAKAYNRLESGNWRLRQAIDILLDHILQHEKESLGDANHPQDLSTDGEDQSL